VSEGEAYGRGWTAGDRRRGRLGSETGFVPFDWTPHDYQAPLLAIDKGVILAVGALGSGKSEPGAAWLVRQALRHPRRADGRPTKWYVIGPDFSLIRQEQFGKILEHCRRIQLPGVGSVVKRVVHGQDPRIVLLHDQIILGRSATDPDRLRGHEIDGFWGDEVQEWPEKAFRIAFSRLRSAAAVRVVLTGSPEDTPGWLWHMISGKHRGYNELRAQLKKDGTGFYAFRWKSAQNTANQEGVLGALRTVMDATSGNAAAQELEGRFPGTHEAPLLTGEIDYARAFVREIEVEPADAWAASVGVDIGETRDFLWMAALNRRGVVLAQERFNVSTPGVPRKGYYPYAEGRIAAFVRRWRAAKLVLDTAKAGKAMLGHLEVELGATCQVVGYATDAGNKKADAIEVLGTALSRGDVLVPERWMTKGGQPIAVAERDHLQKELAELVPEDLGKGRRRWDHPPGGHDDGVVALALAYQGLTGGTVHMPSMFKREWLRLAPATATGLRLGEVVAAPRNMVRFVAVHLATGEQATSDCTALVACAVDPHRRRLVVLDVVREQIEAHAIAPRLREVTARWDAAAAFVPRTDVGAAQALAVTDAVAVEAWAKDARRQGLDVREILVDKDETLRAAHLAAVMQAKDERQAQVWFLADTLWWTDLERELLAFPGGPHRSQVLALACAVRVFNELVVAAAQQPAGARQR
jgi:hypothetical protein